MTKIFSVDFRKGTLIDSVSKTAGTLTAGNGGFKKTEKGTAMLFDGSNTEILHNFSFNNNNRLTYLINFKAIKFNSSADHLVCGNNYINRITIGNTGIICFWTGGGSTNNITLSSISAYKNKWVSLYISAYQDGANVKVDYSLNNSPIETYTRVGLTLNNFSSFRIGKWDVSGFGFNGYISKVSVYNTALTAQKRNDLYTEFLNSYGTEKPIRGFELVKPTDLSYLKDRGLVAAYNMIPSNGTLVDISGNGNSGVINGAISTKDGLKFDGVDDYLGISDTTQTNTAISFRFKTSSASRMAFCSGFLDDYCIFMEGGLIGTGNGINNGTTNTFNDGLWHSVVINRTGTLTYEIYVDGILQTLQDDASWRVSSKVIIGQTYVTGYSLPFDGELSDMRVYNYALTPQQAKDYHNSFIKPIILEDWSGSAVGDVI